MPQRILVTGATGTVGREVVAQLREAAADVRALSREPAAVPSGIDTACGILVVLDSLRAAVEDVVAVFLVWPFGSADGLAAVLALIAERARRVVYLSSAAVRDSERQAERLIDQSGLEWTMLRPHAFAANTLRWSGQIRAEGVVREAYGQAAMSLVHERDIAAVAVRESRRARSAPGSRSTRTPSAPPTESPSMSHRFASGPRTWKKEAS